MSVFAHCFVLAVAVCAGPVLAIANSPASPGAIALVIASPGTDLFALVEDSGGRVIGPNTAIVGALAVSDDPSFLNSLHARGAVMVRDGTMVARMCGVTL